MDTNNNNKYNSLTMYNLFDCIEAPQRDIQ